MNVDASRSCLEWSFVSLLVSVASLQGKIFFRRMEEVMILEESCKWGFGLGGLF